MRGNEYADGMIEHDGDVGKLLKALDDLGVANNTIVIYTTDNGPNQFSWPDAATTPFRSEKDTNWEGAFRVPAMVRWPGHIKAGEISTQIFSGLDWFPTLLAAAGDSTIKDRLLKGTEIGAATFKVHLDGYNQLDYLTGKDKTGPRTDFVYFDDDGDLVAYRHGDWKAVFAEQKKPGGFPVWYEPLTAYRIPKVFNLRMDPYERADVVSDQYDDWRVKNAYLMGWLNLKAAAFLQTFKEYPPSQAPASFTIDQVQRNIDRQIEQLNFGLPQTGASGSDGYSDCGRGSGPPRGTAWCGRRELPWVAPVPRPSGPLPPKLPCWAVPLMMRHSCRPDSWRPRRAIREPAAGRAGSIGWRSFRSWWSGLCVWRWSDKPTSGVDPPISNGVGPWTRPVRSWSDQVGSVPILKHKRTAHFKRRPR